MNTELNARLLDYFDASGIPYLDDFCNCPYCGKTTSILGDRKWICLHCEKSGYIVDYAKAFYHFQTDMEAERDIYRKLNIRITEAELIPASELMDMQFPEQSFIVDGFLAKGLTILAGPSKVGKSWLVLWLAHCVSQGLPVWDFHTIQGSVIYFCLEDTKQRIQKRLVQITGGETGQIYFATDAEVLGNGFEEQFSNAMQDHPEVNLVIVDTLQMVRGSGNERYSYGADYAAMTTLKNLSDQYGVALVVVHHVRKEGATDPFDMISGTTGLMGRADTSMVLKKDERLGNAARLDITGRDIEDTGIRLSFNRETKIWEWNGYAQSKPEEPEDPLLAAVVELMSERFEWTGTATELQQSLTAINKELHINPNTLVRRLNTETSTLFRQHGIQFRREREGNTKLLSFRVLCDMFDKCDISDTA